MKKKLIRITTVPISLEKLLENQLRFMSQFYEVIAISADKERLEKFGEDQEVETYHIELTRRITPIQDLKAVFKLYEFLKKEKPQIVHTHTPKAGIVGMLASYLARTPNRLHTVAGLPLLEATGMKRKVLNFVEKFTYACATKVYPNSYGLKNIILENKFTKKVKLNVLANGSSNGIDTAYFNPELFAAKEKRALRDELNIKEIDFVFIFVGRIVGDKGMNELIAAFDQLSKEKENVKLLLVGLFEADLDPLKKKTIATIDTNKQIISVGYQKDVRPYFAIADILVFPSYREGFPNVVLQAGAMGLPSIVTNINGCNEIIVENKNGWIIPVKSEETLFNAMKNCFTGSNAFNNVKLNARKMIIDRYEQQVVWEAILKEYKLVLNGE